MTRRRICGSLLLAVAASVSVAFLWPSTQTVTEEAYTRRTVDGAPVELGPMPRDEAEERLFLAQLRFAQAVGAARARAHAEGRPYPPPGVRDPFSPRSSFLRPFGVR